MALNDDEQRQVLLLFREEGDHIISVVSEQFEKLRSELTTPLQHVREHDQTLYGVNRDNGMRKEVKTHTDQIAVISEDVRFAKRLSKMGMGFATAIAAAVKFIH